MSRDAVRSAGGWLCDRVRAGWNVTVTVPDGADVRPLTILGVATRSAGDDVPEPSDRRRCQRRWRLRQTTLPRTRGC